MLFPKPTETASSILPNDFPLIKITKNDIGKYQIYTVDGYIHRTKLNIPQPITDLVLFHYAKPLIIDIKYQMKKTHILYCPVSDRWDSVRKKIGEKIKTNRVISLKHGQENSINRDNWHSLQLYEKKIYLVYISPIIVPTSIEELQSEMQIYGVSVDDIDKFEEELDSADHDFESIKEDMIEKEQSLLLDFFNDDLDGGRLIYGIVKAIINGEEFNEDECLCHEFDELLSGQIYTFPWNITKEQDDMIVSWIEYKLDDNVGRYFDLSRNRTEIILRLHNFAGCKNGSFISFIMNSVKEQKMSDNNDYNLIKPSIIFKLFPNLKQIIILSSSRAYDDNWDKVAKVYAFNILSLLSILTEITVPKSFKKIVIRDEIPDKSGEWLKNAFSNQLEKQFASQKLQIAFERGKGKGDSLVISL